MIRVHLKGLALGLAMALAAGCRTVVTTTTEIRPSRYALLEFTRPVSHDSMVAYSKRAVAAEKLKVQSFDPATGTLSAGPVKFDATPTLPALDANVTIASTTNGASTQIRILASSPVKQNEVGGVDSRLLGLAQRIERRLDAMIGH